MKRRGFTIIELIIVIAIMGILLVLAVVNLRSTQINARDEQRKANVDAIAQNLEVYYRSGSAASTIVGRYPSTGITGQETTILPEIDPKSLISPSSTTDPNTLVAPSTGVSSLVAATNATQTTAGVTPQPSSSNDVYIYQPLKTTDAGATWTLCTGGTDECRKFNIYYWHEIDNTVLMVQSKNQ
jgi:prepilin-type N-terminal cleavage/methylation domain-containing protein